MAQSPHACTCTVSKADTKAKACNTTQSVGTASSLDSRTKRVSENGFPSSHRGLDSEVSVHSENSVLSQISTASQVSLQSELSFLSQSSLGFLPALESSTLSDGNIIEESVEYGCVATLKGNDGMISSLALNGEHLYSGSGCQNIRVSFKGDLADCCHFGSGSGAVKALLVAGDKVFSAHQDHKIRVWKRSRQQPTVHKLIATMPTAKDFLMTFVAPKNYVQIRRHQKRLWIEHVDTISVLAEGRNNLLYSGSWDRTIKVWRLSDFRCLESFKAHDDAINALAVSVDGYIYTGSADAKIRVWTKHGDQKKHSLLVTLESHKSAVNALALSPDGSILYSGACDRAIIVWEREDSAQHLLPAGALRGHRHAILCLASVGNVLCSGSADKTIRVWRRQVGRLHTCVAVLEGHKGPVKCLTVTMNEKMECLVYSGSLDHDIKLWSICGSNCATGETALQYKRPLQCV